MTARFSLRCTAAARRRAAGRLVRAAAALALVPLALATAPQALAQNGHITRVAGSGALDAQHLVFDGVDDHVRVPHVAAHALTNTLTVEAWVKPAAFVPFAGIVTKGVEARPWNLAVLSDGGLEFVANYNVGGGTGTANVNSTGKLTLGVWQHVAVSVGGGFVRFYINGVAAGETAISAVTFGATTEPIVIGADLPGGDEFWRGGIDEVRVWNVVRTAAEIAASRTTVFGPTTAGLVGYWDFDELEDLGVGLPGVNDVRDRSASRAHGDVLGGLARVTAWAMTATNDLYEDRVVLAWNRVPSATARYLVRRDGLLLATLSASDTTYTDRAGVAGRAYPYCVSRQDGPTTTNLGCESGRRQLIAPTTVAASDGLFTDKIRVSWTDRSALNTGYRVYRAGTLVATLGDIGTYDDTATASLTLGTSYAYCVAPIQGEGEGPQVCDSGFRGAVLPPATVVATDGTVPNATRITWTAPAGGDPAGTTYALTRSGTAIPTTAGVLTATDVSGAAGTSYPYCVTRTLSGGTSSAAVCDTGGFGTLVAATGVSASDSSRDDRVDVRWTSGGTGAADGTRVTRSGGYGLLFDGVDDEVQVPGLTQSFQRFSVEAWMKVETQTANVGFIPILYKGLLDKGSSPANWEGFALMTPASNGGRGVALFVSGSYQTYEFADTDWHHVAATYDGTTAKLYVDGVEKLSFAATLVPNSAPVMMGVQRSPGSVGVGRFKGGLDEVRVWSTARTQAQVRAGMHATATGAEDGLAALYRFDEGIGTQASDARGGYHGRLVGMNATATSGYVAAGAPVAGHGVRPALAVDGSTGFATATGLTTLPASFTIEFWAKRNAAGRSDFPIGQGPGGTNNGLNIGFRDNNHFILSFTGNDLDTPQGFADTDWHHWAVTYDRASGARTIVRDGALVASDVTSSAYTGTGTLRIGQSTGGGVNGHFGGSISDVRVWSRVRPAAAIAANRYALADTARTGLVAAWAFDTLDPSGTGALATAPGTSASGSATGAVLSGGARLAPGRPMLLTTLGAGATSTSDATAEPGLRYTYCVSAYANAGAETNPACDAGSRARAVAPSVILASDGTFENRVAIAWQGVSTRAATYNVYRDAALIATLPASQASYNDATGAPTTVYTYCVAAFTSDGTESARVCDSGSRVLAATTPSATDDAQEDRVDVTWTDNSGAESGYRVTRAPETNHALTIGSTGSVGTYISGSPTLVGTSNFTIEFWVKPTTLAGDRKLIVLGAYGSDRTAVPSFVNGTFMIGFIDNRLYPEVWDSGGKQTFSAGTVPNGVWSHIAVTYQGGSALIGYVNGVEVGRDASVGTRAIWYDQIGFGGFGTPVSGDVDEMRIWKTARTAAQIMADKDRMVAAGTAGLSGMWSFDEGLGNVASDGAGNVVNGKGNAMLVGPGASWTPRTQSLPAPAAIAETAANATTYADRTGASGVRYAYGVAPFDALGAGVAVTDPGRRVLKTPTGLMVTSLPNETSVSLAWTDNSQAEAYQNLIRTGGGTTQRFLLARNTFSFTDPTPVIGTEYTYHLAAENIYGVSVPSEAVTAKTILLPPSSVSASDTYAGNVVVTWVDVSAIETGYIVTRDGVAIGGTLAANATTYTDATAVAGTTYTYGVQAQKSGALSTVVSDTGGRPGTTVVTTPAPFTTALVPVTPLLNLSFGENTAVSGDWAAISNAREPAVYIYRRQNGVWSQTQRLAGSFGDAVAMADGELFVGSIYDDAAGSDAGAAFVFRLNGSTWTQSQKLTGPTGTQSFFGRTVTIEGDYAAVGARIGGVYVYRRENGVWKQQQVLASPIPLEGGFAGTVSLSGSRLLVGTSENTLPDDQQGSVYVYSRSGTTWTSAQTLRPVNAPTGSRYFGSSVAASGNHAIVGAMYDATNGSRSGAAYAYLWNGSSYSLVRKFFASDATAVRHFGQSVAVRGNHAIIGSPEGNAAYLYRYEDGVWKEHRKLAAPATTPSNYVGLTVAASDEGLIAGSVVPAGINASGAAFFVEVAAPVASTTASDGTYAARVQVRWSDVAPNTENVRIYRNGQKIGEATPDARNFDDFDAPPGDLSTYCVATYRQAYGESPRICDSGWRPADGVIGGRVATYNAAGFGAGVADVKVCLAPPPNNALLVDGVGGYGVTPAMDLSGSAITIEYWFKGTTFVSGVRQDRSGLGHIDAGAGTSHTVWNASGPLSVAIGSGVANGAWHHVAMTWQQGTTNGMRSYLDGVLVEQKTTANNPLFNLAAPIYIGAANGAFTTPGEFSKGQFDEVRIWRRVRTQAEIQAAMRTPLTGTEAGLAAYYTFDQGEGPAGLDQTSVGAHAVLTGGASWTDKSAPVESCSITNADGNFTLAGVRYSTGRTFSVEASLDGHVMQPARQTVTLNAQSPVQNSVAFIDASTYTVAGKVRHNTTSPKTGVAYGTCGIAGAVLSSPGTQSVTTDDQGDFRFGLVPGLRTISVLKSGLTFAPESYSLDLTGDVAGKDFVAGPLRRLIVRTETAGGFAIGTHTLRIRSEDGCYDREVTTDATSGVFLDDLPPLKYTAQVTATVLKTGTGLDQIDVDRYFTGLGAQAFDLTETSDTLRMAYHAPLKIALVGLPGPTGTGAQTCAAPAKLGVATLAQGLLFPLIYTVSEDFGALGSFPAENVRLQIVDEIADDESTPIDTTVAVGTIAYQTAVGQPNVLSGRRVDGVDRSYQKSIQVTATVGARTASRTDWAVVTGQKARNGSFVSFTTEEVPLYVLRDPPGDASYSYLEKGTGYCFTLADWSTSNSLGMVSNFSNMLGAHNLLLTAPLGLGVAVELQAGIGVQGGTNVRMTWRREGNTQVCMEAKERFSTSADPEFVGADADVFIGAAFNMLFAQTDEIRVNGQTCAIEPLTGYGVAPDPTKPVKNTYAYTTRHIRDVLIPQIEALKASASATDTTRYSTYIANWQRHLAYNEALKVAAATVTGPEQRSFSGGADFAASFTSDTTYYNAWSTHMYNDSGLGIHQALKIPGLEFNAGWQLKFTRETTFELPGFTGAPPFNGSQSLNERRTTGYVLSDRNAGDSYAVNVRPEKAEEIKVFVPNVGSNAADLGYGAVSGVLSGVGGGLKVVGVIGNLAAYLGGRGATNGSIVGSIIGTGLNLVFGLSQGAYDLGALLDPQNVTSAAVETKLRVPFGSPIFQTVAGTSSCPWQPDPVFAAIPGGRSGMMRRDLPTLAIGRTSLVNADPNKPAVFSLFLGNASESNETRRYVLRSVNERNPNGAVMRVNGTPIHEGVVFTLAPGKQIEATLSVERGPTRFRYDSLQVILYPECAGLPASISEKEGATQTFSVSFKSVSSPITLYTSPRFDLDFGTLPDAALGDSLALADFTLETIDYGDVTTAADDVYLTDVGVEYRPATSSVWTTAFAATRAQIIAASPQGAAATTYYSRWKPKTTDVDGAYVFRAYTRSTGGGPSGAFFYGETMPGRIDRKAPLVFGTPQPASEVLALGADVAITFDEAVAPTSVLADSSVSALTTANLRLVYADGAESGQRIRVKAVVSGASVVMTPVAGWAGLEGRLLRAELRVPTGAAPSIKPLTDVIGNVLASSQTWTFVVRRSVLAWSAPTLSASVTRGVSPRVTVNLANGRTDAAAFTLSGVPAWLTPSVRSGTIAPGAIQPIAFTGADTLSGGTYTANVVATIGATTLPLAITVTVDVEAPVWTVDATRFQHTMSVTAQLFVRGRPSVDANDRVAAFVGGELRGVASVTPKTSTGQPAPDSNRVALTVYSNAASGEIVTFKVWDADATAPVLYSATSRSLAFTADAIEGTPTRPLALHAPYVPGAGTVALNAGWTWVSFPRVPASGTVTGMLSPFFGASPVSGDVVKSQRSFAMFSGSGASGTWVGPLADTLADPQQSYMVRLSSSQDITLGFGGALADTTRPVALASGWTWLGFPRSRAQGLDHALAAPNFSAAPVAGDLVKSQTAFAQYVPGSGWVGSLTQMEPGRGYMMRRASASSLTYPAAPAVTAAVSTDGITASESSLDAAVLASEADAQSAAQAVLAGWTVNPSAYAFNMTAIASVEGGEAGMLVGAFVGDSLRGFAPLRAVTGASRPLAFLMAYGNAASGESLAFRLLDPASGEVRLLTPTQPFAPDAALGTPSAPLALRTTATTAAEALALPTVFSVDALAPNPFASQAVLRYALPSAEQVRIEVVDVMGRRVAVLADGRQEAGRYAVTLDGSSLASGVYIVTVRAGAYHQSVRVTRVR